MTLHSNATSKCYFGVLENFLGDTTSDKYPFYVQLRWDVFITLFMRQRKLCRKRRTIHELNIPYAIRTQPSPRPFTHLLVGAESIYQFKLRPPFVLVVTHQSGCNHFMHHCLKVTVIWVVEVILCDGVVHLLPMWQLTVGAGEEILICFIFSLIVYEGFNSSYIIQCWYKVWIFSRCERLLLNG